MVNENDRKILSALAELSKPASGKEVAEVSGLDSKDVSKHIKSLKKEGFVDSPVRCKYGITDSGKEIIS